MLEETRIKRKAFGAGIMSFIFIGLGQIYNGQPNKAIYYLAGEIIFGLLFYSFFLASFNGLILSICLIVIFRLFWAYDAYKSAKQLDSIEPNWYNRWYFYIGYLIIMIFITNFSLKYMQKIGNYRNFLIPNTSMANTVLSGDNLFVELFKENDKKVNRNDLIVFEFPGDRDEVSSNDLIYYMDRCVAVSGDTLQIINNQLFVNNKEIPKIKTGLIRKFGKSNDLDSYMTFPAGKGYTLHNYGPIIIPKKDDIIDLNSSNFNEWEIFIKREGHNAILEGTQIFIDGKQSSNYKIEHNYYFGMGDNRDNSSDSRTWGFIKDDNLLGKPLYIYFSSRYYEGIPEIRWNRIGMTLK